MSTPWSLNCSAWPEPPGRETSPKQQPACKPEGRGGGSARGSLTTWPAAHRLKGGYQRNSGEMCSMVSAWTFCFPCREQGSRQRRGSHYRSWGVPACLGTTFPRGRARETSRSIHVRGLDTSHKALPRPQLHERVTPSPRRTHLLLPIVLSEPKLAPGPSCSPRAAWL